MYCMDFKKKKLEIELNIRCEEWIEDRLIDIEKYVFWWYL